MCPLTARRSVLSGVRRPAIAAAYAVFPMRSAILALSSCFAAT